ncbi:hypothetical protein ACJRO7_009383 [Eucalyptus globulus]|uniref:Uncharacterized protein n=1 Tax=Eucalyptus globulus TaxID=34317 RepID=A0ABD3L8J3_EUCGL
MMTKKSIERKWVVIAVAAYLLITLDLLPSQTNASLLATQHVPDALGGSEEDKTKSPRKALGGEFKLKGAIGLDSYIDFGKKKRRTAVKPRNLRVTPIVPPPSPRTPSPSHQFRLHP